MKLFKFITTVDHGTPKRTPSHFTDWYDGTEAEARAAYDEDLHRYGLSAEKLKTVVIECDPQTNKPLVVVQDPKG